MTEPSREDQMRALAALTPFVSAFNLPMNPEDLELMAYVVLRYARSDLSWDDIAAGAQQLIEAHIQHYSAGPVSRPEP